MKKILVLSLMLISGALCAADVVSAPADNAAAYADARSRLRLLKSSINSVSVEASERETGAMENEEMPVQKRSALAARLVTLERDSFIIAQSLDELKKPGCVSTTAEKAAARELTEAAADTLADARRLEYILKDSETSGPQAAASRITGYMLMAAQTAALVSKPCETKKPTPKPVKNGKTKAG